LRALVTGGAGFIGSSIADRLIADGHEVVVLDDISTGFIENIPAGATLVKGDIADEAIVREAVEGCEVVFHQAAHRAVFRSVEHPLQTDRANVGGTLTVLVAARDAGVRRVVAASSSSVYGGAAVMPTDEGQPLTPRSPYAVTKLTGEHYLRVFTELFGLETVALRYFNVYGPRQRPDSQYAAVLPLFIDALRTGGRLEVHGDGLQTRDFTYISDVVAANVRAASAPAEACAGKAYNIAGGAAYSLMDMLGILGELLDVVPEPVHTAPRPGDVKHTRASIEAARRDLGHDPAVEFRDGLRRTVEWFVSR
jgi:UDP-glucose 4-epimerase